MALLAALALIPVTASAAPPDRATVCHHTSDDASGESGWQAIQVSVMALDQHLAHGDGFPGAAVPDSSDGAIFDENCLVQTPDAPPPDDEQPPPDDEQPPPDNDPAPPEPDPSEVIFALAYADTDPTDGGYNASADVLIAKLIDGPGAAADGSVGPGDLVITNQYPLDFGPSAFGQFGVTEHTVTDVNVGLLSVCNVDVAGGILVWSSGGGEMDLYQEYDASAASTLVVLDGKMFADDTIEASASSPSQPLTEVATIATWDDADQSFIDVETDCSSWSGTNGGLT